MDQTQNTFSTPADSKAAKEDAALNSTEDAAQALMLLLRSPRLSLSTIMELLEIGDREFRELSATNEQVARLLQARRDGTLVDRPVPDVLRCEGCGELYVPYAGRKVCSDTCAKICQIRGREKC